jgi:hypothetical protein
LPLLDSKETEPERVLDRRLVKKGNIAIVQVQVKWTGIPTEAATWEDWNTLKSQFPAVGAWGQAQFLGEEDVTTTAEP